MNYCFKYNYSNDIVINLSESTHLSIIGNSNELFLNTLINKNEKCSITIDENSNKSLIDFILFKDINKKSFKRIIDELLFNVKQNKRTNTIFKKYDIENILNDLSTLGISDKFFILFLSTLIKNPRVIVIDNVLSFLDYNYKKIIYDLLDEYIKQKGIIINITNDIEEALESNRIIVLHNKKIVCDGKTLSVLNEEKLLKRLSLGMPFIVELNKYLMDYGMINKYYMTNEKLVDALWK